MVLARRKDAVVRGGSNSVHQTSNGNNGILSPIIGVATVVTKSESYNSKGQKSMFPTKCLISLFVGLSMSIFISWNAASMTTISFSQQQGQQDKGKTTSQQPRQTSKHNSRSSYPPWRPPVIHIEKINNDTVWEDIIWYYAPIETVRESDINDLVGVGSKGGRRGYSSYKRSSYCNITKKTSKIIYTNYTEEAITRLDKFFIFDEQPILKFQDQQQSQSSQRNLYYATCQLMKYEFHAHLPHYMQQLFRCWSFWQHYPHHVPAFITQPKKSLPYRRAMVRPFTHGLVTKILPEMGIQVLNKLPSTTTQQNDTTTATVGKGPPPSNIDNDVSGFSIGPLHSPQHVSFQVTSTHDMHTFRHRVIQAVRTLESSKVINNVTSTTKKPPVHDSSSHPLVAFDSGNANKFDVAVASGCVYDDDTNNNPRNYRRRSLPRIAVINRKHTRRLMNSQDIIEEIQSHITQNSNNKNMNFTIPEIYFEGRSFEEQVIELSNIDILITPHGAQETGILFQPTCGGVFEYVD